MDGQPDILAFGQRRRGTRRPGPARPRPGWIAVALSAVLLACLGAITYLALLAGRQDGTINALHAALRNARSPAPATAAAPATTAAPPMAAAPATAAAPALGAAPPTTAAPAMAAGPATTAGPVAAGSAMLTLPGTAGGSFSVIAVAIRPGPDSAAHTWLFVTGRHAGPGERYGLLEDTCGGQYVTASDLADGTADRHGDLTIVAPDLAISPRAPDVWILVYRWKDGAPLGGVQGPLIGTGTRTFRTAPAC